MRKEPIDLSSEVVEVVHGHTSTSKSYDSNDRIVDVVFTQANTEICVDVPLAENQTPASFEVMSGQGVYCTEEQKARWVGHKIFIKSSVVGTAKIRVKY